MVAKTTTPKPEKQDKPKRTVLTPAERVKKLEAELEAARKRAEERANAGRVKAQEKRAKLVAKRDELTKQIDAIDAEYPPADAEPVEDSSES